MFPILQPFLMLFMAIILGAVLTKFGILDQEFNKRLSRLVVKVSFPAMLFLSMYQNISMDSFRRGLVFSGLGLGTSVFLAFTAALTGRHLGLQGKTFGTYQILCTNGNNVFLPVPLISAIFGLEYVVYAFLFELGAGFFYWSYGISHFRPGPRFSLKRVLNQNISALFLGLLGGLSGLALPQYITGFLEMVANIAIGF
ncbi:MAG: hypothetical protein GX335_01905, partial [Firmicutes bacterium]|nr:hypothetical protein [Bacillota bacterium]